MSNKLIVQSRELRLFFFVFTASGFAGLIYESIWTQYLKLFLGHAAYAQVLVLAVFMGGMAIGSMTCSKYSARLSNLLIGYVVVEVIIGLYAVFFHPMYVQFIDLAYSRIIPALGSPLAVAVFKWAAATLLILPQSILLGMTFPLMTAGLIRRFPTSPGTIVAMLYFTNSIGAAFGVLSAGFLFIGWVGLPGTLVIAAFINIMVAAVVWIRDKKLPSVAAPILQTTNVNLPVKRQDIFYMIFLLIALSTGLSSFIYEIGWIRMLSLVLGASTHAFELMLSAFIMGLALGGLWVKRRIDTFKDPRRFLALVQIAMGILAMATLPLYSGTFNIMAWLIQSLPRTETGYLLFNLSSHGIALVVMLPAAFCAGMTLPLITTALLRNGFGEKSIGAIYGFNTIGAILGVGIAINIALPLLGLKNMIIFGAGIDIALGLGLAWWSFPSSRFPALYTAVGVVAVMILTFGFKLDLNKMASGVYRSGSLFKDTDETVFHHDGKTATVSITKDPTLLTIRTNGKPDASIHMTGDEYTTDEDTMVLLGSLGIVHRPKASTAAVIGWGSGMTTHTLLADSRLASVDTIEIEPEMIRGATLFGTHVRRAYNDPRSHPHIEDAKSYFSFYNKKYDLIISEPSNPWVSGVASLFTKEFYSRVRGYLGKNGLFIQWIQLYEFDMPLLASIMNALSSNFADYVVYSTTGSDLIIVASPDGSVGSPDTSALSMVDLNEELRHIDILSMADIQVRMLGNKKALSPFIASYDVTTNSDYAPFVDLYAVRARYLRRWGTKNLLDIHLYNLPIIQMLGGYPAPDLNAANVTFSKCGKSFGIYYANLLLQFFSGEPWAWPHAGSPLPDAALQNAIVARQVLTRECSDDAFSHEWWKAMIHPVAGLAVNSSPAQLKKLFDRIEIPLCSEHYTSSQRDLIALLKAVGKRDPVLMARFSEKLLIQMNRIPTDADLVEYILAAGLLGNLSSGNGEKASVLWNQYGRLLPPNKLESMPIQFLLAHINSSHKGEFDRRNVFNNSNSAGRENNR